MGKANILLGYKGIKKINKELRIFFHAKCARFAKDYIYDVSRKDAKTQRRKDARE